MAQYADWEITRMKVLATLDAGKSQVARNKLGQFATPPDLAKDIVRFAMSNLPASDQLKFLEPGFGTGTFYSALRSLVDDARIEDAVGYEIDPYYARAALELWNSTGLRLILSDFTLADPPAQLSEQFNLIVCNPPYVRHHHLTSDQKLLLRDKVERLVGIDVNGLTGLYAYFMILSRQWMADNAIGAWLVPSEFMDVNYGQKVKEFLLQHVSLIRVHRFDPSESQFSDALVSSTVVVFRNTLPKKRHEVEFSYGGSVSNPHDRSSIATTSLRGLRKWSTVASRQPCVVRDRCGPTLADLFAIKRGLATGDNKYFIFDDDRIKQLDLPRDLFTPILPSPRYLKSDTVLATAEGDPQIERRRYLLSCDLPEEKVCELYPALWDYFKYGISIGVKDRYLCRHRRPWYAQERRPPAPILCSYMGRIATNRRSPFRFIRNYSMATAPNVYLMLYPRSSIQEFINSNPRALDVVWSELGSIASELLAREGRVYGGGLHKMEPRELGNVCAKQLLKRIAGAGYVRSDTQQGLMWDDQAAVLTAS